MISKLTDRKVLTSTAEITLDDNNILHVDVYPEIFLEKRDIQEHLIAMKQIAKRPTKNLLIVDVSEVKGLSVEGKQFSKSEEMGRFVSATAGIVSNPISRVLGNFYTMFSQPPFQHALFSNKETATRWLLMIEKEKSKTNLASLYYW